MGDEEFMQGIRREALEGRITLARRAALDWQATSSAWLWLHFQDDSVTGPDDTYMNPEGKILAWAEAKGLALLELTEEELTKQVRSFLGAWARRSKQLTLERRVVTPSPLPHQPYGHTTDDDMMDEFRDAEIQARRGVGRRVGIQAAGTVAPEQRLIGDVEASEFYADFYIYVAEHPEVMDLPRAERVRKMASFAVEAKERAESPPQDRGNQKGRKRAVRVSYDALAEMANQPDWDLESERIAGLR